MNLKILGVHEPVMPNSLATCLDFVSVWGSTLNRAQLGRLCAAAIGVCVDHAKVLPAYKINTADPLSYGHKIMERLLESGVSPGEIYEVGAGLLLEMAHKLPTEDEVETESNF